MDDIKTEIDGPIVWVYVGIKVAAYWERERKRAYFFWREHGADITAAIDCDNQQSFGLWVLAMIDVHITNGGGELI